MSNLITFQLGKIPPIGSHIQMEGRTVGRVIDINGEKVTAVIDDTETHTKYFKPDTDRVSMGCSIRGEKDK